jgi:hypothetical protein
MKIFTFQTISKIIILYKYYSIQNKTLKHYYFFFSILTFNSFNIWKASAFEKELLKEKSWNQLERSRWVSILVDCDKLDNKPAQCFFEYLTELIQQKLSSDTLSILYPELDTHYKVDFS